MKKRLAKKILQCKSPLHKSWAHVQQARNRMQGVKGWIILEPFTVEDFRTAANDQP